MSKKPIYVTQPALPPLQEFIPYLEEIWESRILTNNGPFHQKLEAALCQYLQVNNLALFTNGTVALVTALQALRITGEVITTPYSFVATSHSLLWNNLKPVFVDIEAHTLNLDPARIEEAITPNTTAIMPVHCYGNPCDVEGIKRLADIYGLKVIYDAAHAFAVQYKGKSLLNWGDLSVLSLHATKVFNTFEGGAIVCPDKAMKERLGYLKNFGFADEVTVTAPGINGKMSEMNAALGLLQLKYIDQMLAKRKAIESRYRSRLAGIDGVTMMPLREDTERNSSYFPIFIGKGYPIGRDALFQTMREKDIYARRYFYPLISSMPMYRGLPSADPKRLPIAVQAAQEVLCLPIYPDLSMDDVDRVCDMIIAYSK